MNITTNFIELITNNDTLNKTQCKILNIDFPTDANWQELLQNKEISEHDVNKLILLKGIVAVKSQEQIDKNYMEIIEFKKNKTVTKETPQTQKTASVSSTSNNQNNTNVSIYCDGACSGNPGKSGSGLAVYKNAEKPVLYYGNYEKHGTNNTAELKALYKALLLADEIKTEEKVMILSDSKYSIDCISTWAYSWKRNGWTKKFGEIKNLELIKNTHNLYEQIKNNIIIKHVKGHSGVEGNELADRMALHAIKAQNDEFEVYSYTSIDSVL
ncbi:ribonuclease H [Arcobacteraceae bacterium]|nr:ribonuclease H [Arcobacteraceae bacterium]